MPLVAYLSCALRQKLNIQSVIFVFALFFSSLAFAIDNQKVIEDIQIKGIKNLSPEIIFANIEIGLGDLFEEQLLNQVIYDLFALGYFDDIQLLQDGNTLIIDVKERPSVNEIEFVNNKLLKTKALLKELEKIGIAPGEILKRSFLEDIINNIDIAYNQQGRFGTLVSTQIIPQGDNNIVNIKVTIQEAPSNALAEIVIIGNNNYSTATLLHQFESQQRSLFSRFFKSNKYQRSVFGGDLQRLKSFYLNRGYSDFTLRDVSISLGSNKQNIYITIVIDEGQKYFIRSIDFLGNLILPKEKYTQQTFVTLGEAYSAKDITNLEQYIITILGNDGYGNAQARTNLKKDNDQIDLVVFVNPKERMYVRRINIFGNKSTNEAVIRRELSQLESSWFSRQILNDSIQQIRRLPYIGDVTHTIRPIPNQPDKIDIDIQIVEAPSGSITGGLSYSTLQGPGIVFRYNDSNFLGEGVPINTSLTTTKSKQQISFSQTTPFFTIDGVTLSNSAFINRTDFGQTSSIANYAFNSFGATSTVGYPIGGMYFGYGGTFRLREFKIGEKPIKEVVQLTDTYGHKVAETGMTFYLSQNRLNRGRMPTAGGSQRFDLDIYGGGDNPKYYDLQYSGKYFIPLTESELWTMRFSTRLGYAQAISGILPFTAYSYVGGYGTLRGFTTSSQGVPATTQDGKDDSTLGGNILVQQTTALIFPLWYETRNLRFSLFHDAANVYVDRCLTKKPSCKTSLDLSKLKRSYGVSIMWHSVVGPIGFHFNRPINPDSNDGIDEFEFSLGQLY